MNVDETLSLLEKRNPANGLSTVFAIICILDVFGVFPVVTLAKPILDCGFYGILVILVTCSIQIYTAILLSRSWIIAEELWPLIENKNRYPYAALAEITGGRILAAFVTFLLDLTVFSAGIPNLIVASQNLQLFGSRISNGEFEISYCYWITIIGFVLCPILWIGSPKDMKCICTISALMVVSVFLLICGGILRSDIEQTSTENNVQPLPWKSMLQAYGILAFQFDIHPSILTILVDMKDKKRLPTAVLGGFGATLCMFGVVAILSSLKFGSVVHTSILETLNSTVSLHIASLLVALQLCLTSAIGNNALYQQIEDCMNISRDFNSKRCIVRTTLSILAIVIAESVPHFDLVMSLIGGTLTSPLIFILPPAIYLKMLSLQSSHPKNDVVMKQKSVTNGIVGYVEEIPVRESESLNSGPCKNEGPFWGEKAICVTIIIFSSVLTIFITYINGQNIVFSYSNSTMPCIYNITMTLLYL